MAIIVLDKTSLLPAGQLRAALAAQLPATRWICGEDDTGGADLLMPYRPRQLLCGRSATESIFIDIALTDAPLDAPAPPHARHVTIGQPTIDAPDLADRITMTVICALMAAEKDSSACQLHPDGNWLGLADAERLLDLVQAGQGLDMAERLGNPAAQFAASTAPEALPEAAPAPLAALVMPPPASPPPPRPATPPRFAARATASFGRKGL